jgi:hypothetical protein
MKILILNDLNRKQKTKADKKNNFKRKIIVEIICML